jgi:GR25 family glycosyltransferase involved in LPS biosynthesis
VILRSVDIEKHFGYSLVLEDDQVLPKNFIAQIVELLLRAPHSVGAFMLDDSFFFEPGISCLSMAHVISRDTRILWIANIHPYMGTYLGYAPPARFKSAMFPLSYPRNETRTCGAYLLSHKAAKSIRFGGKIWA